MNFSAIALVFVDQSPIGKTARSNPVSFVGAWNTIREIFANAPLSKQRGYTSSKFSFNNGDGRCQTCGGPGFEHVEMQFLSDVYLRCPDCFGARYRPEVMEITIERSAPASASTNPVPEPARAIASANPATSPDAQADADAANLESDPNSAQRSSIDEQGHTELGSDPNGTDLSGSPSG